MTTLGRGAGVVFTPGLTSRPASTAFLASRAAPIITDGLDVLVHEVIAAITTWPWSTSVSRPSSSVTGVRLGGRVRRRERLRRRLVDRGRHPVRLLLRRHAGLAVLATGFVVLDVVLQGGPERGLGV